MRTSCGITGWSCPSYRGSRWSSASRPRSYARPKSWPRPYSPEHRAGRGLDEAGAQGRQVCLRTGHPFRSRGATRGVCRRGAGRGARDRRRYGFGQEHARTAHESAPRSYEWRGARRRRGCDDAQKERAQAQGWSSLPVPRVGPLCPDRRGGCGLRPRQLGLDEEEVRERVLESLRALGAGDLAARSPFALSGGEKRRAAIAGVLAMRPEVLVLDEPTAGLDPATRQDLLNLILGLRESGVSV